MSPAVRKAGRRLKAVAYAVGHLAPAAEAAELWLRREAVARARQQQARFVAGREAVTPHCAVVTVVATYRRPQLLQRAVASALAQTVDDHHVVVVDDGGGELPSFPPSARLHVVQLPENTRSAGLVRNVGILLSRSTYVAFLDDDNTWLPDHLERALAVIDRERADACYLRMEVVDERGSAVAHVGRPFSRRALRRGNYIDLNALVARRSPDVLFSPMPRRRASTRKEDWELVYRLSRHGRIVYDPHVTVRYLRNPASHFSEWLP